MSELLQPIISIVLTSILAYLVSSNNLSLIAGMAIGSRLMSTYVGLLISAISVVLGFIVEGSKMVGYSVNQATLAIILAIGILMFAVGEYAKVPMSITGSLYMSWAASVTAARGYVPLGVGIVVTLWLTTPIILSIASYATYKAVTGALIRTNPIRGLALGRIMMVITVFMVGFSFGANNLGLLWSLTGFSKLGEVAIGVSSGLGILITGKRTLGQFSRGIFLPPPISGSLTQLFSFIMLEASTLFSIPISLTLCTLGSMLGISAARGVRLINIRYVEAIVVGYILSMASSYAISLIILRLL